MNWRRALGRGDVVLIKGATTRLTVVRLGLERLRAIPLIKLDNGT